MPVGDVVGELLAGTVRLIAQGAFELVLEVLVKGPGHAIARLFKPGVDPDGGLAIGIGLLFWGLVGVLGFGLYWHHLSAAT